MMHISSAVQVFCVRSKVELFYKCCQYVLTSMTDVVENVSVRCVRWYASRKSIWSANHSIRGGPGNRAR